MNHEQVQQRVFDHQYHSSHVFPHHSSNVTPQILLGQIDTRSCKGPRAPTHYLVLLVHATMIMKGSTKYGYDASMKINHVGKLKMDVQDLVVGATTSKRQDTIMLKFTLVYKVSKRYVDLIKDGTNPTLLLTTVQYPKHI